MNEESVVNKALKVGMWTSAIASVVAFVIPSRHLVMKKHWLGADNSALYSSETPQWVHDIVHLPDSAWYSAGLGGLGILIMLIAFSAQLQHRAETR